MRNSIKTELKLLIFKNGSVINLFIAINVFFFLFVNLVRLGEWIPNPHTSYPILHWIELNTFLPTDLKQFITKPWTLISYMFMHEDIFHILFNMLILFFIGKIFEEYLGERKFTFVYLCGGMAGGLLALTLYKIIPALSSLASESVILGASAGVMAIVAATATLLPNYSIFFIFIGSVPLKWIALAYFFLDLISIRIGNPGGHITHLGGAMLGFFYINQLNKGNDWAAPFVKLFQKKHKTNMKVVSRLTRTPVAPEKNKEQIVDEILDKISKTGMESLSEKEKQTLKKASQDI